LIGDNRREFSDTLYGIGWELYFAAPDLETRRSGDAVSGGFGDGID
jgi:hypothetical protein